MSIYDKTSQQNGYKRGKPQHMKGLIMTHPQPTSYSDSEKLKSTSKIKNKACMPTLTTFIHHSMKRSSQRKQTGKRD